MGTKCFKAISVFSVELLAFNVLCCKVAKIALFIGESLFTVFALLA